MKLKTTINLILTLVLVIALFIVVSLIVQNNLIFIKAIITNHFYLGIFVFIVLEISSIVIAPITTIPLLPVASNAFGWPLTFLLSFISWTIGSLIAFIIAREYGKPFVEKFMSLEQAVEFKEYFPKKHIFIGLIVLRIIIPADVLSYALGLFTKIDYKTYIITLIIGTIPSAFFFSYLGSLPILFQSIGWIIGITILFILVKITIKRAKLRKQETNKN